MRAANFFTIFVGIESPDTDTLVAAQKKQNTRRSLADSVHKIYKAGLFVHAGFILGFDTEKGSIAEPMIESIEAMAIPVCMAGLLYALPTTQLTRRLEREGRLHAGSDLPNFEHGDQCTAGLNFETARPRRDILVDYATVLERIYDPAAYFGRVRNVGRALDMPKHSQANITENDQPRPLSGRADHLGHECPQAGAARTFLGARSATASGTILARSKTSCP